MSIAFEHKKQPCACGGSDHCACEKERGPEPGQPERGSQNPQALSPNHFLLATSTGLALPDQLRSDLEMAYSTSLGDIRVHVGAAAGSAATSLGARAFTVGRDVGFGPGEYRPGTIAGDALIAHEVAHTIQQRSATSLVAEDSGAGTALEHQANSAALGAVGAIHGIVRRGVHPLFHAMPQAPSLQRCKKSPPGPATSEFFVTGHEDTAATNTRNIFFERMDSAIPADQAPKIPAIITVVPAATPLFLDAYTSEDEPAPLADARATTVDAAFAAGLHPHTGPRTKRNQSALGVGRIDYRNVRKVEVQASTGPPPAPTAPSTLTRPCGTAFAPAKARAVDFLNRAIAKLTPPIGAPTMAHLVNLFGGTVPGPPAAANATAAAPTVLGNLTRIRDHISIEMGPPGTVECHTLLDGTCKDSPAYNVGHGPSAVMTLCPDFLDSPVAVDENAATLIHEGSHGTAGLAIVDVAYGHTRMIQALSTGDAERNTDSYRLLVQLIASDLGLIAAPTIGVAGDVRSIPDPIENRQAAIALAHLEKWLTQAYQDMSDVYASVTSGWASTTAAFDAATMHRIAPLFGLTDPGTTAPFSPPTTDDRLKAAGIYDRFLTMRSVMWSSPITMTKVPAGVDAWAAGPGASVNLTSAFFALPNDLARVRRLLELIVAAHPGISAALRPKYVDAADEIRRHRGLGP
jgi:uncharacterized protein DUF4157/lysine-specific metallo-endopeptidase family protein